MRLKGTEFGDAMQLTAMQCDVVFKHILRLHFIVACAGQHTLESLIFVWRDLTDLHRQLSNSQAIGFGSYFPAV